MWICTTVFITFAIQRRRTSCYVRVPRNWSNWQWLIFRWSATSCRAERERERGKHHAIREHLFDLVTVVFYICRYRYCYLQFVAIAFYCIYVCMNLVHNWQLFLKNKRWDDDEMRFVVPLVTLNMQISNVPYNIPVLVEAAPNTRCPLNSDKLNK